MDWAPLASCVESVARDVTVGVSVCIPGRGQWHYRGDERFPAASTAKIPIMVEAYRSIERAEICLHARHIIEAAAHSPGSGVLQFLHAGIELTTADLLFLMMAISDNTATNALIHMLGMERINETMRMLDMRDSVLGRPMVGRLAVAGEQENIATACDYTRLLKSIIEHRAASPAGCEAMLGLLQTQQNNRRIGRAVPAHAEYQWGAKNGTNLGVTNEVGFISTSNVQLIIAVYLLGVSSELAGEVMIGDIARSALASAQLAHTPYESFQ